MALALGSSDGEGEGSAQLLWAGSMTGGVTMSGQKGTGWAEGNWVRLGGWVLSRMGIRLGG